MDVSYLLTDEKITERNIGIGDEVFMTGLFSAHRGQSRNQPIIRTGSIAMMPTELVPTRNGPSDVYLIEARSIGGLSGSPAFVRETALMNAGDGITAPYPIVALGNFHLLGITQGHWDLPRNAAAPADEEGGINMGIAIVTPAKKLLEVLNQPDLVAMRERQERDLGLVRS